MYTRRQFVYEEDQDTGITGLRPLWMPHANATTMVAHDILEHFSGNEQLSAAEDELLALGALLALRIENGLFNGHYSDCDQLANVVLGVLSDLESSENEEAPRAIAMQRKTSENCWALELIDKACDKALELTRGGRLDSASPQLWLESSCPDLMQRVKAWVAQGYARTWQRFYGVDLYTVGGQFYNQLNRMSRKLVDSDVLQEGDKVDFWVSAHKADIQIRCNGSPIEELLVF